MMFTKDDISVKVNAIYTNHAGCMYPNYEFDKIAEYILARDQVIACIAMRNLVTLAKKYFSENWEKYTDSPESASYNFIVSYFDGIIKEPESKLEELKNVG